ncbi:hypothetical protein A3K29_05155 [Candidatus Collierbacteria bacterium RIFOXYB2_FULL_46_14]|uniref:Peptidase C39-like domain-containing protein n=1 Tax=Candidatus Collierbacteria bacterium GW2011_GWA2_46_26 TaxID=1618381 RepID=A0A0G1PJN6_9BACT|nr:MAG: hypothetical protein UX47_C0006G0005 [Candidatus Collierbacteria bacterium GW2011_GWA2_46_26]OGD73482.1 MAG: hypothetical protein A3K29_05155 [Candidatus Collierbacteria bacterium RIFOXYB2_FULL_46_14]OGD76524.1 MAG: hypothetical protein A3K43_05155 [Candidatus Collierbacteria bacterium RIFOXYA2_FULL_46_20]OGD77860.1 MAG: hypothetical protein A3K39_05155 [Candidatus Collierbacteria bacterium RIFOXYC2_FULL_43_15]OGD81150.1 MAG: hypothetical protein A2320_05650 [Pseudomonadales bacterium G
MKSNITLSRARQETGSYCGPAVMQMLVSSLGLSLDQEAIVDACKARDTVQRLGLPLVDLAKGLRKIYPELMVWQKEDSSVEDIHKLLEAGYIVGVDWQGIFNSDEYGDDAVNKWSDFWNKITGVPEIKGEQGHYCVALEVNKKKGYLRFADPYGHYAGKDRFVALWEFEERWWDDRIGKDARGKKIYVLEKRLIFVVAKKGDQKPAKFGMVEI